MKTFLTFIVLLLFSFSVKAELSSYIPWGTMNGSVANQPDLVAELNAVTGGWPSGVFVTPINKTQIFQSKDGLVIQQLDSATQTNTAGGFNGGGTGQKAFVELWNYNNAALSSLTSLKFTGKNLRDGGPANQQGNLAWNILMNFNNGFLTAANDYAILVEDGLPSLFTLFHIISNSAFTEYTVLPTDRSFKVVGGTGVITFTGNVSSGSNEVTAVSGSNINALTVGMYVRKTPTGVDAGSEANMPFPDGSTISSIDVGANKFTVEFNGSPANSALTSTGMSFKQYGGVAPVDRSGTSTAANATITGITNTADLQVNMSVTGPCITGTTYIASMVANTSITVGSAGAVNSSGSCLLSFKATGKTGIPGNAELVGIPLNKIVQNNPSAFITNNAPLTPIWAANDGGAPKNFTKMGGIQLNQGSSSITTHRTNVISKITINSDEYKFTR